MPSLVCPRVLGSPRKAMLTGVWRMRASKDWPRTLKAMDWLMLMVHAVTLWKDSETRMARAMLTF